MKPALFIQSTRYGSVFLVFSFLCKVMLSAHKAQTVHNNAIKSDVPLLKSRITERITPKHKHFPTNTYQYKFKPTHTNAKILPTPTKIHQNYGIFTLIPTHLMTHFPPTYLANQKKYPVKQHPTYQQRQPQANNQHLLSLIAAYNVSFKG